MKHFSGAVYRDGKFSEGFIGVEDGVIIKTGTGSCPRPAAKGIILPTFINAHTHIGDSAVKFEPKPTDSFMEIVAPPNGLKHRMLARMTENEIVGGMKQSADTMLASGISTFVDFRESGVAGVQMLRKALKSSPLKCIAMGRPAGLEYDKNEVEKILKSADGIGASSISDWDRGELQKLSSHAHSERKLFALHASERVREDIDRVLDLKPAFLVHMLEATDSDLERCADAGVPIVVCPRSSMFFGKIPDIPRLIRKGCTVMLGTDNAMLASPDFFKEMETAYSTARLRGGIKSAEILRAAIDNPRKALSPIKNTGLTEGSEAEFMVLNLPSKNPDYLTVAHAGISHISHVQIGRWHRSWKR